MCPEGRRPHYLRFDVDELSAYTSFGCRDLQRSLQQSQAVLCVKLAPVACAGPFAKSL
jgi:hypothetical protein